MHFMKMIIPRMVKDGIILICGVTFLNIWGHNQIFMGNWKKVFVECWRLEIWDSYIITKPCGGCNLKDTYDVLSFSAMLFS